MKNRTVLLLFTLFMIISFAMSIASLLTPDWVHTESTLNNTFVLTQLFQGVAHGSLDKPCLKISINGTEISNNCPFLNPSDVPNGAQRGVYGLLVSGIVFSFLAILCGLLTICYPTVIQPTKSFMFISGLCLLSAAIVFPVMFGDDPIDGTVYNLPSAWKVGYSYTIQIIGACVVFVAQIVLSCFKYGDERYV